MTALGCAAVALLMSEFMSTTRVLQHKTFNTLLNDVQNSGGTGGGPPGKRAKHRSQKNLN